MNLFLRQTVASALDDVLTSRSLPPRTRSTAVTALSDTLCAQTNTLPCGSFAPWRALNVLRTLDFLER